MPPSESRVSAQERPQAAGEGRSNPGWILPANAFVAVVVHGAYTLHTSSVPEGKVSFLVIE